MRQQQTFDDFVRRYKPLRFKFMGLPLHEHMPPATLFDWPHLTRIRLKSMLGLPITYFDLRASMTPIGKKRADMAFLTHFIKECDRDAEDASRSELMRYFVTKLRYWPELWHVNRTISSKQTDNYMVRWGYLLDYTPEFAELIHGTDSVAAWDIFENFE